MAAYPTFAPEFQVRLNGEPLPAALRGCVSSVTYEDGIEGADRVDVSLANPSLRWLDHPLLQADTGFSLSIGYAPGPLEEVFVGEITGVEPTFPAGGMPMLRITAQDFLHRLMHGSTDRAFKITIPSIGNFPLPDVAAAAIVSGLNQLIPNPDPIGGALSTLIAIASFLSFPQFAQISIRRQEGENDFDFLTQLAQDNGWEVFIDHTQSPKGRVLKFQFLMQSYTPDVSLKWGQSLIDFTPRLTTVGDLFGVSASVWVDSLQMEFVIVVSWDYDRASFNLSVYPSSGGDIESLIGTPAGKTLSIKSAGYAVAARDILAELLPRLNNRLTGSGSTVGNPKIKAGRVISLDGLGAQFSGSYRVTSASHSFDAGGYRTNFTARKEVWFGSVPLPTAGRVVRVQGQFSA